MQISKPIIAALAATQAHAASTENRGSALTSRQSGANWAAPCAQGPDGNWVHPDVAVGFYPSEGSKATTAAFQISPRPNLDFRDAFASKLVEQFPGATANCGTRGTKTCKALNPRCDAKVYPNDSLGNATLAGAGVTVQGFIPAFDFNDAAERSMASNQSEALQAGEAFLPSTTTTSTAASATKTGGPSRSSDAKSAAGRVAPPRIFQAIHSATSQAIQAAVGVGSQLAHAVRF
jgi:hypothetical protein